MIEPKLNLQLLHDLDKLLAGVRALGTHVSSPDDVPASISVFSASSGVVKEGEVAAYEVKLVNNTDEHCWLSLFIDIYWKGNPVHPDGHRAYFAKDIFVSRRAVQKVQFLYDWEDRAVFGIDGVPFPADDAWFGPCREQGSYLVKAVIRSQRDTVLEELTLVEQLTG